MLKVYDNYFKFACKYIPYKLRLNLNLFILKIKIISTDLLIKEINSNLIDYTHININNNYILLFKLYIY